MLEDGEGARGGAELLLAALADLTGRATGLSSVTVRRGLAGAGSASGPCIKTKIATHGSPGRFKPSPDALGAATLHEGQQQHDDA